MTSSLVIGVDIGGTKIGAAAVTSTGEIVARLRGTTPRTGHHDVLVAVAELVASVTALANAPVIAIGVGAPGVVDPVTGVVLAATDALPLWGGAPVRAALERATGLPVSVENDVRVMAHAESALGSARGLSHVLYASIGTGVGGAITRDGKLVRGAHGTAGEIGHLLLPVQGAVPCGCGRRDHLEAVAAGPSISAEYARRSGESVALPEIVERMRCGDAVAQRLIEETATLIGRVLAGLVTAVDLDAVVMGGGVAQIGEELLDPMRQALQLEAWPRRRSTPVLSAALGTDAPMIGAALLARQAVTSTGAT